MDYVINTTTEKLSSTGGLALVGKILEKINFLETPDDKTIKHPGVLKSLVGLFAQGRTRFEEIDLFRNDSFFRDNFNLKYVPAKETLRLYMEQMVLQKKHIYREMENISLRLLKSATLTSIKLGGRKYLPA